MARCKRKRGRDIGAGYLQLDGEDEACMEALATFSIRRTGVETTGIGLGSGPGRPSR
jgi:hypothetical protein